MCTVLVDFCSHFLMGLAGFQITKVTLPNQQVRFVVKIYCIVRRTAHNFTINTRIVFYYFGPSQTNTKQQSEICREIKHHPDLQTNHEIVAKGIVLVSSRMAGIQ